MWTISEIKETGKRAFKANYWFCVLAALLMGLFAGSRAASSGSQVQNTDIGVQFASLPPEQQKATILAVAGGLVLALVIGLALNIFLINPINVGGSAFFKGNVEYTPAPFNLMGTGFRNYGHTVRTMLLRDVYLLLWGLLGFALYAVVMIVFTVLPLARGQQLEAASLVPGAMLSILPLFIILVVKSLAYSMVPYIAAENPGMPAGEIITRSRAMMKGNKWRAFVMHLSFIGWILLGIVTLGLGLLFWTTPYMHSADAALYLKLRDAGREL